MEESMFTDTHLTGQRAFVAILTSTYLLLHTRFTRLLQFTPSRTEYDKSSTPRDMTRIVKIALYPSTKRISYINDSQRNGYFMAFFCNIEE